MKETKHRICLLEVLQSRTSAAEVFETSKPVLTSSPLSPQVAILLYVADLIVRLMWRRSLDPDNFSIPYLTALGDLLGTGFLALCFRCVSLVQSLGL